MGQICHRLPVGMPDGNARWVCQTGMPAQLYRRVSPMVASAMGRRATKPLIMGLPTGMPGYRWICQWVGMPSGYARLLSSMPGGYGSIPAYISAYAVGYAMLILSWDAIECVFPWIANNELSHVFHK